MEKDVEVKQEVKPEGKGAVLPIHQSKPEMVKIDVKLLMTTVNRLHKVDPELIDCYNGLINAGIDSGKIKMQ